MKPTILFAAWLLASAVVCTSCGGKDKKAAAKETTVKANSGVPNIDIASLKDEAAVTDAMQKVVDARMADDKKKKEDPAYSDNYLELLKLYTAVLNASTEFSKTITDPAKRVEFMGKISMIQDKMYAK